MPLKKKNRTNVCNDCAGDEHHDREEGADQCKLNGKQDDSGRLHFLISQCHAMISSKFA